MCCTFSAFCRGQEPPDRVGQLLRDRAAEAAQPITRKDFICFLSFYPHCCITSCFVRIFVMLLQPIITLPVRVFELGRLTAAHENRDAERQHTHAAQIHHHDQNDAAKPPTSDGVSPMVRPTVPNAETALKQALVHRRVFDIRQSHRRRQTDVTPPDHEQGPRS